MTNDTNIDTAYKQSMMQFEEGPFKKKISFKPKIIPVTFSQQTKNAIINRITQLVTLFKSTYQI